MPNAVTKTIRRRSLHGDPTALPGQLHDIVRRVYAARRVTTAGELDYSLGRLHPTDSMGQLDQALELLVGALREGRRIVVVGDYDADGATSCALAVRALRALGAAWVDYAVPDRTRHGYGLSPALVAEVAAKAPGLIVTVDNGVSSVEGVRAARAQGIGVLVTDHHLAGDELPAADAIVNPNLPGDAFPSKHLAGVGVIFYVLLALRSRLRALGWFAAAGIAEPNFGALLDLVALGTVADVVPLDHNNRILVAQGLSRIRAGRGCPGVQALVEVSGRGRHSLAASDLAFAVGPRLNAAGRLDDMSRGIECLLSDDFDQALTIARQLDELNRERRRIEAQMKEQALAHLDRLPLDRDGAGPVGLCLFDADWHPGVVGILAGRVKDLLHRPVIAFACDGDSDIKGSARAVPGFHVRDALQAVAARHPGLILRFGGHAMAAGLTLPRQGFDTFAEAFDREARQRLGEHDLAAVLDTDGEIPAHQLTVDLAEQLRAAGPWGQGFPAPLFDGDFEVVDHRMVGEKHLKMVLRGCGGQRTIDAIAFYTPATVLPPRGTPVRLAYRLEVDEWRGRRAAQLIVEHFESPPAP